MQSLDITMVRGVVAGLSQNGSQEVSNAHIYAALGLTCEAEKARCRSRIEHMLRLGELKRDRPGHYTHIPKSTKRSGESYIRMWRAVRAQTGTFANHYISSVSHVTASQVSRYLRFLQGQGYIRRNGKSGNIIQFSVTHKGREQRETPYPELPIRDPFAEERAAMSRLARLFFEKDLYNPCHRQKVVKECETIMQRFTQEEQQ